MITLYAETHWDSPFVLTVYTALKEKGLAFDERALDLQARQQHQGDFPERSLTARVPTLVIDDFVLSESLAIVEYLEERFSAPGYPRVLPADREARARARQVLSWLRSDLPALRRARPTTTLFFEPSRDPLPPDAQADASKLIRVASLLLPDERSFLFGAWSVADVDLALALRRLSVNGDPLPPRLAEYAERQWQRPSVQAFVTHPRQAL